MTFLDALYYHVEGLKGSQNMTAEMKSQFIGLDMDGYLIWRLQIFVREFIQKEITKLGLDIGTK